MCVCGDRIKAKGRMRNEVLIMVSNIEDDEAREKLKFHAFMQMNSS